MRGLNADSTAALWKLRGCVMLGRRGRRASEAGGGGRRKLAGKTENIGRAETSIRIRGKREQKRSTKNQHTQSSVALIPLYLKKAFIGNERFCILQ